MEFKEERRIKYHSHSYSGFVALRLVLEVVGGACMSVGGNGSMAESSRSPFESLGTSFEISTVFNGRLLAVSE